MFRQDTTIVVGAGASCEIGLPSGDRLKQQIGDLLDTTDENAYGLKNPKMLNAVKTWLDQPNQDCERRQGDFDEERIGIREAAKRISRGLPLALSIDNFLHTHQADAPVVRLGKAAIAMSILVAERNSAFYNRTTPTVARQMRIQGRSRIMTTTSKEMMESWYVPFVQLLMSGVSAADVGGAFRRLRFVIFNYDRCLEQYLWLALQSYFDLGRDAAADILSEVEFLHPYGSLGPLPWQAADGEQSVSLGGDKGADIWQVGSRIRTFTESVESALEPRIKSAMRDASTIILLGFGYLDQNVQLLAPGRGRNASRVISSAYGVSLADQEIIREVMRSFASPDLPQIMLEPGKCRDLFDNYRLQLSLR